VKWVKKMDRRNAERMGEPLRLTLCKAGRSLADPASPSPTEWNRLQIAARFTDVEFMCMDELCPVD